MKMLIIICAGIIITFIIFGCSKKVDESPKIQGKLKDIENHLNRLMASSSNYGFLIIEISGTSDFIQLSGDKKGVQLDFPLATDHQKSLEANIRQSAKVLNLEIIENKGSDGTRFLDIDLKSSPSEISKVTENLLKKVFKVSEATLFDFQFGK
jgi:hypothetical protein